MSSRLRWGNDCAAGFRTGSWIKLHLTDTGSVDLVFNVDLAADGT